MHMLKTYLESAGRPAAEIYKGVQFLSCSNVPAVMIKNFMLH